MDERVPMTPRGYQTLRDELVRLKNIERPKNAQDILEARAHGDISENAEFHAAKERQAFIEGRIRDLESRLARANVIDPGKLSGHRIVFGATVTLDDTQSGEEVTYSIVGDDESDVKAGRISVSSPLARALIGREVGDTARVTTPRGPREYEVVDLKFEPI
jgi:transcription elongation factor GreA